ncbi:hypothetical protein E3N88_09606 [Mikania micrantha]|uniref:Transposase-associated domain-containing protein n=1 Tax=Mikania micrantha TaxID=192012 RepID=A0A5N6PJI7_9ASTR|nr:hypothetical protein E3N88_09606 [Mikania micrantha]
MGHLSRIAAVLQLLIPHPKFHRSSLIRKLSSDRRPEVVISHHTGKVPSHLKASLKSVTNPTIYCLEILHCSVRRLYKSLKFTHGRGKYTKKPITASTVTEVRMYEMTDSSGFLSVDYCDNVNLFLDFAFSDEAIVDTRITMHGQTIREIKCPCFKCQNLSFRDREIVQKHLYMNGFMLRDTTWHEHEENVIHEVGQTYTIMEVDNEDDHDDDGYEHMVLDSIHSCVHMSNTSKGQEPNKEAKGFYDMLQHIYVV